MGTILVVGLIVVAIGAFIAQSKMLVLLSKPQVNPEWEISPERTQLLREIVETVLREKPTLSPEYTEPIHRSYRWKKDIGTFTDSFRCKRTKYVEAVWYPNKQWLLVGYSNGFRNNVFWYIVKNIDDRTANRGRYGNDKNELRLVSPDPFGDNTFVEISPHDWRLVQAVLAAAKKSVESFNQNAPAMNASLAH